MSTFAKLLFALLALSSTFATTTASALDFSQSRSTVDPVFGAVTYGIVTADMVFFDRPQQAVVLDDDGYLLAATPVTSGSLSIRCNAPAPQRCTVYDLIQVVIYEPVAKDWTQGQQYFDQNWLSYFPDPKVSKGFRMRVPSLTERLLLERASMADHPLRFLLLIVWWTLAWILIARLGWRWWNHRKIASVRALSILSVTTHLIVFTCMAFIVAFSWPLYPYSAIYGLFVCLSGALSAILLVWAYNRTNRDAFQ